VIYFLIFPAWAMVVTAGVILLFFGRLRWLGVFAITVSTSATAASFVGSTLGLLTGAGLAHLLHQPTLGGVFAILGYLAGLAGFGVAGAALGGLATWLAYRKVRAQSKVA
jgi:hypothetical protein